MKMRTLNKNQAFTIIEILMVMILIVILAGLIGTATSKVKTEARKSDATADIAKMQTALAMYEVDNGTYPDTGDGNATPLVSNLDPQYLQHRSADLIGSQVVDPWGNAYHYAKTTYSFQIHSNGPDEVNDSGANDDIKSW